MEHTTLTTHARLRMGARRIPAAAIEMAFLYGREKHLKGATFFAIGRREVERFGDLGIDLRRYEGIQVVCVKNEVVVTVYKNRDFSGLRPKRPRKRIRKSRGHGNPGYYRVAA